MARSSITGVNVPPRIQSGTDTSVRSEMVSARYAQSWIKHVFHRAECQSIIFLVDLELLNFVMRISHRRDLAFESAMASFGNDL